jgi:eukaryotic-like serine/threonine-protein kinase
MLGRVFMGRYEILRLLGEGGMGRVYLARQTDLGRQVVVKIMHDHIAADPVFRDRFRREMQLMAHFQHPYAVTLYDASLDDPQGPCIVMEYIRGVTLDVLLHRNSRLTPMRVGRLLGQLCEVLQAAHSDGIIHRDLKPANLMVVDPDTPYEIIKVMDFGLAKPLTHDPSFPFTLTNGDITVGTPGYMCPEQARGEPMDHRGDLYSVGAILFELLAGRLPFSGSSTMDVLLAHATEEPPKFADVGASNFVSPAIEAVVLSALAKDPKDRPNSARELAERYEKSLLEQEDARALTEASIALQPVPAGAGSAPRGLAAALTQETGLMPEHAAPTPHDSVAVIHHLEAWMPERVAAYKLRGFVQDVGGEILESVPGRIRVRLGGKNCLYTATKSSFSWFGLARRPYSIDVELQLNRPDPTRDNLQITISMRPGTKGTVNDEDWRNRCMHIFCDLRAYLMGQGAPTV